MRRIEENKIIEYSIGSLSTDGNYDLKFDLNLDHKRRCHDSTSSVIHDADRVAGTAPSFTIVVTTAASR